MTLAGSLQDAPLPAAVPDGWNDEECPFHVSWMTADKTRAVDSPPLRRADALVYLARLTGQDPDGCRTNVELGDGTRVWLWPCLWTDRACPHPEGRTLEHGGAP